MYEIKGRNPIFSTRHRTKTRSVNERTLEKTNNFNDIDVESQTDLKDIIVENFRDYCDESSIHGLKYIGKRKRFERISWTIICVLLLCGCGTQIFQIIGKWLQNPLVFLMDTKVSSIKEIDFPAITICPQRMPNRGRYNYTEFLDRFLYDEELVYEDDELMLMDAISKVCFRGLLKHIEKIAPYLVEIPTYNNSELIDVMDRYFLPNYLKFFYCTGIVPGHPAWECNLRFTRIWLKEGLCYSFNLLPKDQIFRPDVHYPLADKPNLVFPQDEPRRTNAEEFLEDIGEYTTAYRVSNHRDRFHVRTRMYEDFTDPTCHPDFYVFIHNPHEIPWDRQSNGFLIQAEEFEKNVLTVTPYVTRTDDNIKKAFSPEQRDCYFDDERPLKFFQKYSQHNCELECMANASFHPDHFNCTSFWMPRTADMPLCHFEKYIVWYNVEQKAATDLEDCNCLPDCNYVDYGVTVYGSHSPFFEDKSFTKDDILGNDSVGLASIWVDNLRKKVYLGMNQSYYFEKNIYEAMEEADWDVDFDIWNWKFSEIEVHFEESNFLAMRRHLAYSFADFVSQIGGIFGCFLGISIFSIIEIIYFCTIRMIKKVKSGKKYEREREKQPQRQIKIMTVFPKAIIHSERY